MKAWRRASGAAAAVLVTTATFAVAATGCDERFRAYCVGDCRDPSGGESSGQGGEAMGVPLATERGGALDLVRRETPPMRARSLRPVVMMVWAEQLR